MKDTTPASDKLGAASRARPLIPIRSLSSLPTNKALKAEERAKTDGSRSFKPERQSPAGTERSA